MASMRAIISHGLGILLSSRVSSERDFCFRVMHR